MNQLSISQSDHGEWSVVAVEGEIDVASSPALSQALDDAVSAKHKVIIDLLGVTFVDSTGLGALVQTLNTSVEAGGELRLAIKDPNVLKVFEVTALDGVFAIYASVELAAAG
jgi:anti-sigma B factor antagonist